MPGSTSGVLVVWLFEQSPKVVVFGTRPGDSVRRLADWFRSDPGMLWALLVARSREMPPLELERVSDIARRLIGEAAVDLGSVEASLPPRASAAPEWAGHAIVPRGIHRGRALADVFEDDERGAVWVAWALTRPWPRGFAADLADFARTVGIAP